VGALGLRNFDQKYRVRLLVLGRDEDRFMAELPVFQLGHKPVFGSPAEILSSIPEI
jgi:hypothetical protein